jgi:hypothetical protein
MDSKTVWERRIERMRDAGMTREQVETVFDIISEARSFHSQKTEDSARSKLDAVYGPKLTPSPWGPFEGELDAEERRLYDEQHGDPTAPLRNTEEGDYCANHGGTFEGTYSDKLDDFDPAVDEAEPICSEVDGGFAPYDQGCRFVPADSTDEARINTPLEDDVTELRGYALRSIEPSGWGVPTYFEDEGWTFERYTRAYNALAEHINRDDIAGVEVQ